MRHSVIGKASTGKRCQDVRVMRFRFFHSSIGSACHSQGQNIVTKDPDE